MPFARHGLFQYLWSFVKEIQLESTSGDYSSSLEVILFEGRYMLNTPEATYSFEDRYTSYRSALKTITIDIKTISSVLVLGLGLGSIPQMMQKLHHYRGEIDCVEIDNVIIRLAEKYYPSQTQFHKLKIYNADALQWIRNNENKYDLIAVDLFISKIVPEQFHQIDFLIRLKDALSSKGVLLFSRLKENINLEQELSNNLFNVFEGGKDIDTGGNLIYCYKSAEN